MPDNPGPTPSAETSPFEAPEQDVIRAPLPSPTVSMGRRVAAGALDTVLMVLVCARSISDLLIALGLGEPMYSYTRFQWFISDTAFGRLIVAVCLLACFQGIPLLRGTTLGWALVGARVAGEQRASRWVALSSLFVCTVGLYGAGVLLGGLQTHVTSSNPMFPSAWVTEPLTMYAFVPVTVALVVNVLPMLRVERTSLELLFGATVERRAPTR